MPPSPMPVSQIVCLGLAAIAVAGLASLHGADANAIGARFVSMDAASGMFIEPGTAGSSLVRSVAAKLDVPNCWVDDALSHERVPLPFVVVCTAT